MGLRGMYCLMLDFPLNKTMASSTDSLLEWYVGLLCVVTDDVQKGTHLLQLVIVWVISRSGLAVVIEVQIPQYLLERVMGHALGDPWWHLIETHTGWSGWLYGQMYHSQRLL